MTLQQAGNLGKALFYMNYPLVKKDHACWDFPCKFNDNPCHRVSEHKLLPQSKQDTAKKIPDS